MNDKQSEIEETDVLKKQVEELTASLNEANRLKEKFRLTQFSIDKLSVPAFWMKKDGSFFYVNDAACRFLGYTVEELLSLKVFDIDLKFQRENWDTLWHLLKEKKTSVIESVHRTKEGVSFPVEIAANYIEYNGEEYNCAFAINISERKKTEKELNTAANILKNVSEAIIATDTNFTITGWNPGAEHMYEWEKEEVIGRKLKDILKIEYPKDSRDAIIEKFTSSGFYKGEVIHHKKDGTPIIVFSSISVIRNNKGNVIGAVSINSDITENKRITKELKLSEDRFKIAFQTSPDLININRLEDGKYIDINEGFTKVTGYTEEDIKDKTSLDINIWKNPADREKVLAQLREKGVVKNFEAEFVMKDGSTRYGLMSAHIIDLGMEKQILSVTHDITRQKLAEKTLRKREENYRTLFETNLAGVYKSTVDGKIIECNNAFIKIMGYDSKEEMLNTPAENLYVDKEDRLKFINKLKEYGTLVAHDYLLKKKDGSDVWISENVSLIDNEFIFGTLIDITERKKYEQKLIESEYKFKDLTEKSLVGVYLIVNGLFAYVNPKLAEIFGYTVDELTDKLGPKDLTFPEDWHTVDENLRKRINGEINSVNYSFRGRKKDGSVIFVEVYGSRTIYKETPAVVGTLIDITERMKIETELNESRSRYRRLFEEAPIALWEEDFSELISHLDKLKEKGIYDFRMYFNNHPEELRRCAEKVKVLDLNNAALDLYQADTKEELLGSLSKSLDDKALSVFKEEIIALSDGQNYFESESETLTAKQNSRHIFLRLYVGQPSEGVNNYSQVLLAIDDITERKLAEAKLMESLKSYQSIFDNASDAIYIQDSEGRFLDVNEGAIKMYGYSKEELIGRTPEPLSAPGKNDLDRVASYVKKAFEGEPQQFEFWGKRKNGEIFPKIVRLQKGEYFGQKVVIAFAIDTTETKRAEEAIREREENLSLIYDTVDDIIFQLSVDPGNNFRFTSINKKFLELTGLKENQVIGKRYDEVIPEPAHKLVLNKYLEAIREKKTVHWEETSKYPAGELTGLVSISPNFDTNGKCNYLIGSVHDITERKRAEEKLRKSEIRYRSVVENAAEGISLTDEEGKLVEWNHALEKLTGIKSENVKGKYIWDVISEFPTPDLINHSDKERIKTGINEFLKTGEASYAQKILGNPFIKPDGTKVYVEQRMSSVKTAKGFMLLGTAVDITDRKLAEIALIESEKRFRTAFITSPDSININRLSDGLYVDINEGFTAITGYTREETIGKTSYEINIWVDTKDRDRLVDGLKKYGRVENLEAKFRMKDGTIVTGLMSANILDINGVPHILSVTRNIEELKKAQERLKESHIRMRSLAERLQMIREEERARVAREIHDDLGQLLTAIKMDTAWLAKNSDTDKETLSGKLSMMLELVNSSIQSVKRIATELRPGLLDDLGLIAAIEWQSEEFQKRTNIRCDLKVDEKEIVLDDEISIAVFRIFQETLTNVTRHSGATKVFVSLNFTDDKLNMEIADNGVGITESQINSSKSLGLIGMKERVHILNGDFEIFGEPGNGTTVRISVPLSMRKNSNNDIKTY